MTVQGTTTTLDTVVQEVDLMNIQANTSTPAIGVTQSGSGAIIAAYDGASEVFRVDDGGNVGIGTDNPQRNLEIWNASESNLRIEGGADYFELRVKDSDNAFSIHRNIAGGGSNEDLRITSGGNLNIGGNYTQTTYTSQITGTLNVTSTITQDGKTVATTGKAIAMAMVFG